MLISIIKFRSFPFFICAMKAETINRRRALIALFNLLLVALVGVLLRYKILFPLPLVHHKHLLHGHSHFAFSGWVSTALFTCIVALLMAERKTMPRYYTRLFWAMQITSYGMLLSFPFQGYGLYSIIFSTLSVLVSYVFVTFAWRDAAGCGRVAGLWLRASFVFYIISSFGAFFLAWLMATGTSGQDLYLGAAYFFLHFQYNGWFLFAIGALFFHFLDQCGAIADIRKAKLIFYWLALACVPALFLSVLWMKLPAALYWLAVAGALLQLPALFLLLRQVRGWWQQAGAALQKPVRILWSLAFAAFLIKIVLQSLSPIPAISLYAFGFRPIVIGYLHLVLLGFVTLFLLGYLVQRGWVGWRSRMAGMGLTCFTTGLILNEACLMGQGVAALYDKGWRDANYYLLACAILMFAGMLSWLWANRRGYNLS